MKTNRIDFVTLGCSKNLVDTERVMRQLERQGYAVESDPDQPKAPIAVINTCGFIGDAKEESIRTILQFCERKKHGKLQNLYVMGCLSQRYLEDLKLEIPEVDGFFGKFDFEALVATLGKAWNHACDRERVLTTPSHYAYVKISEGCNRTCSYCAIPLITGPYKSRPMEDILEEVRWLVGQGVCEFQLIAQDLSWYGCDLYKTNRLAELVRRISDEPGVRWIRLHYAYPAGFPDELLDVMRERDNVCKYLDIALQHISDAMLKKMRRGIDKKATYELLARLRREVPGICLRTTLMVGHPGETEADFEELKQFVKDARFDRMGAFAYSEEENTYAATHYADDVPDEVKHRRLDELMALQQQVSAELNQQLVGREERIIIDRLEGDYYVGRSQYDSPEVDLEWLVKADKPLKIGHFYQVRVTSAVEFDLYAQVVSEEV
ncbi:MAG: 30S ribosomal protein S12 methylthiotransferase RimO [Paludibacteraceae bacterium]|nr:30S ribosomal protein S12 methylthiotransferase RimO [Paludibacteraceae bacterium]